MVCVGLLIGLLTAPLLWFGAAATTRAQTLPFTPTPEPTETPTPQAATATNTPASTPQPIVIVATPTAQPASATPQPTAVPPGYGRDLCDPNHSLQQPCALATETEFANLNFNSGASDVFSFLLKGSRQYRISAAVGSAGGIDPAIEVFLAGTSGQPLATNDDEAIGNPSAAITVTVQTDAWYLVRVTNKAPGNPAGKIYTLSARSMAASDTAEPQATNPDDLVGNAYDVDHAARLAWNLPYDLSMVCPDLNAHACYAGRHTFLIVAVKQHISFTAFTYDLGAGVDTVLTAYRPDSSQTENGPGMLPGWRTIDANDDIAPGWTLRSQISFTPDWTGSVLLVVAPSNREDLPPIPAEGRPGRYRLIVGGPALPNVKAALDAADQDLPPTPEPTAPPPTGQPAQPAIGAQPASTADSREVIRESCPTGQAVVGSTETGLYAAAPPGSDDRIASYPPDALITLLGQCYRGWVKVQPTDSVTPGWMWGPDLRPAELSTVPTATAGTTNTASIQGSANPTASGKHDPQPHGATAATTPPNVSLVQLEPLELPTASPSKPAARVVTVKVCHAGEKTDTCTKPIAGLQVELLLAATRQVLSSNLTDTQGTVMLSVSLPAEAELLLIVPALGLEMPLDQTATDVPILLPNNKYSILPKS